MGTEMRLTDWEYKTVLVTDEAADLCIAGNRLFGWILIEVSPPPPGSSERMLTFGRENTVADTPDMIRMGKRLDFYIRQVNALERLKIWAAFRFALFMNMIGLGMLGMSMRAFLFGNVLFAAGLFGFGVFHLILTRFLYSHIRERKTVEMNDLLRQKRNEIEELLKQIQQMQKNKL